ncbi:NADH dehydrogenase subunit 5 [Bacillus sp. CLL-7-23]|uniref:Probable inorganic carbon transporter subunit DabB n=1 Tax=Bacillus changyiensis TaxID=3004103 RepID=A0ABT4X5L0_9BACI|nr:NADH dehydrogenase subunit 5 [Bacillus changyiensis]MDA7026662.1 NADH dehydrogenase subunit 5 [Bacillus changyiensis]
MFLMLDSLFWLKAFFASLAICLFSSFLFMNSRVPLQFVRIHARIMMIPPLVVLPALLSATASDIFGHWRLDPLAWLMAFFVSMISVIVQRFSVRYLLGDRSYRKFFFLLTLTTGGSSMAWLNDDLRWLLVCWGITLFGLTNLISLNNSWQVAKNAALYAGRLFILSWLALTTAVVWLSLHTGHWQLSQAMSDNSLSQLNTWDRTGISMLLILAVMIPGAQWPFHRWLLDSAVVPTPVSAVMHAGLVNVGGIIFTRFSPLFSGDSAQIFLLFPAIISVLLGTGMMIVQTDYKRKLAASTIAQMGFMLIQCALGAYIAAVIHLVLHGLFKAALFLQAGSAVRQHELGAQKVKKPALLWNITGAGLGISVAIITWITSSGEGYQLVSAFILGWALFFAWTQLITIGHGRIVGFLFLTGAFVLFCGIHFIFYGLLKESIYQGLQQPTFVVAVITGSILLIGGFIGSLIIRYHSFPLFVTTYLWLIKLSEPHPNSVESQPIYLTKFVSRGGCQS